ANVLRQSREPATANAAVEERLAKLPDTEARRMMLTNVFILAVPEAMKSNLEYQQPVFGHVTLCLMREDGMRVLLTGASGFIGGRVMEALLRAGHRVVTVSRREVAPGMWTVQHLSRDFSRALNPADGEGAVQDIDVVINAVGILREKGDQKFDTLHHRAPAALFRAAAAAGVPRIVQVSALGADEDAVSPYHLSKKDRKSTRLNSSHVKSSYAVFCLKKKIY